MAGVFELAPAGVESSLRAPGDVDDLWWLVALAFLERAADAGLAAVVVGGFDQQPPRVGRAGLGDRSLTALLAGGVLAGNDPEVGRELVGVIEAVPFADLGAQADRGQRGDLAQASQPRDRRAARRARGELFELCLELVAAGDEHVVRVQVVSERQPGRMIAEAQAGQPRAMPA